MTFYLLDENHKPYVVDTVEEWAKGFEISSRRVARTELRRNAMVSTVFLGLNHNYFGGKPLLFESMVFMHGDGDQDMERYATWDEAVVGHEAMAKKWTKYLLEHGSRNQREGKYLDRLRKRKGF